MAMLDWFLGHDYSIWCSCLGGLFPGALLHTVHGGNICMSHLSNLYL